MTDKNLNLINQETAVKSYSLFMAVTTEMTKIRSADLWGVRLDGEEDFVVVVVLSSFVLCLLKNHMHLLLC